jgi:hypothetical protein
MFWWPISSHPKEAVSFHWLKEPSVLILSNLSCCRQCFKVSSPPGTNSTCIKRHCSCSGMVWRYSLKVVTVFASSDSTEACEWNVARAVWVHVGLTVAGIIIFQSTASRSTYVDAVATGTASTYHLACWCTVYSAKQVAVPTVIDVTTCLVPGL